MIIPSKVAWLILIAFFIFDNIWSYLGVSYYGLREANKSIAWLVEAYPILYFFCIPLQIILIVWIKRGLVFLEQKYLGEKRFSVTFLSRATLTTLVIYWALANSSINLLSLLFGHLPAHSWTISSFIGVGVAVSYFFWLVKQGGDGEL